MAYELRGEVWVVQRKQSGENTQIQHKARAEGLGGKGDCYTWKAQAKAVMAGT